MSFFRILVDVCKKDAVREFLTLRSHHARFSQEWSTDLSAAYYSYGYEPDDDGMKALADNGVNFMAEIAFDEYGFAVCAARGTEFAWVTSDCDYEPVVKVYDTGVNQAEVDECLTYLSIVHELEQKWRMP